MPREARRSHHAAYEIYGRRLSPEQIEEFYAGVNQALRNHGKPIPIPGDAEFRALLLKAKRYP